MTFFNAETQRAMAFFFELRGMAFLLQKKEGWFG
jgi:hypothetical protein